MKVEDNQNDIFLAFSSHVKQPHYHPRKQWGQVIIHVSRPQQHTCQHEGGPIIDTSSKASAHGAPVIAMPSVKVATTSSHITRVPPLVLHVFICHCYVISSISGYVVLGSYVVYTCHNYVDTRVMLNHVSFSSLLVWFSLARFKDFNHQPVHPLFVWFLCKPNRLLRFSTILNVFKIKFSNSSSHLLCHLEFEGGC